MEIYVEVTDGTLMLWANTRGSRHLEEIMLGTLAVWEKLLPLLRYFSPSGPTGITAKSDGFTISFQRPTAIAGTQCHPTLTMPVDAALRRSFEDIADLVLRETALAR